jgi:hypothetical protein
MDLPGSPFGPRGHGQTKFQKRSTIAGDRPNRSRDLNLRIFIRIRPFLPRTSANHDRTAVAVSLAVNQIATRLRLKIRGAKFLT